MPSLQRINRLPANFGEFVEEVAVGLGDLYGERAGSEYRATAAVHFRRSVAHPEVDALALCEGKEAAALLFTTLQDQVGRVSFIHVLRRHVGRGLEERLVKEAVRTLRAGGVEGILCEHVPFCPLTLGATYRSLAFDRMERLIMSASLDAPGLACELPLQSVSYGERDWPEIAELIVAAYQNHPGTRLHDEVRDAGRARAFLSRAARGSYGAMRPEFGRAIRRDGACVGALIGCRIAADVGFVVHVVVRPGYQRQGLGTLLMRELAGAFRGAGLSRMALGVTAANPARRLYTGLGFEPVRAVDAYVWWRP